MRVELPYGRRRRICVERANAIIEYLNMFHNRQGRHGAHGMFTPIELVIRHDTVYAACESNNLTPPPEGHRSCNMSSVDRRSAPETPGVTRLLIRGA